MQREREKKSEFIVVLINHERGRKEDEVCFRTLQSDTLGCIKIVAFIAFLAGVVCTVT